MSGDSDVQSLQVFPGTTLPSAVEPVRMSCSLGFGDPGQAPGTGCPRSSTNKIGFPLRSWRSARSFPTIRPLALNHGPLPIRSRALVGLLLLPGSRSTLKYARHVLSPDPTAVAKVWQIRSAPAKPPRLPVLLLALVTKKPMLGGASAASTIRSIPLVATTASIVISSSEL